MASCKVHGPKRFTLHSAPPRCGPIIDLHDQPAFQLLSELARLATAYPHGDLGGQSNVM